MQQATWYLEVCIHHLSLCAFGSMTPPLYDDVIKWKYFPRYWPLRGKLTDQPVTRSFDVFFDVHLIKRLSKQSWGWWIEKPSCPLWRHFNSHKHSNSPDISHSFTGRWIHTIARQLSFIFKGINLSPSHSHLSHALSLVLAYLVDVFPFTHTPLYSLTQLRTKWLSLTIKSYLIALSLPFT